MNHQTIEDEHVVQRYLLGKLPEEEKERFEEHYLDCPQCLDRLEEAEALHRGLRAVAAQDIASVSRSHGDAGSSSRSSVSRSFPWGLAAAALILALGAAFLARQVVILHDALDRIEVAAVPPVEAGPAATERAEPETAPASGTSSLEAELAQEREARQEAEGRLAVALNPPGGTLLAFLSPVRSGGMAEDSVRIQRPAQPARIVFFLEIGDQGFETYRAVLRQEEEDEALWQSAPAPLPEEGELVISLLSSQLPAGRCSLVVEGLSAGREAQEVARFELSVSAEETPDS